ncbi:MAG: ABATE domain-containing protein [Acetobacteraceae bacterium]
MTPVTVATIRLFGDHPVLDFTNTVQSRGADFGPDVLTEFCDLLSWGMRVGVIDTAAANELRNLNAKRSKAALGRAKALREALYRIFAAHPSAAEADLDLLQKEARAAQTMRVLVSEAGGFAWRGRATDSDTITHRIALAATDLITSPALGRVHVCPGDNCAWLFLDKSRSGRHVWCSEETCGTRHRVRRWRSRRQPA